MSKENCKYWDKCYQKNAEHLQRFNHPPKLQDQDVASSTRKPANVAPKRKYSPSSNEVDPVTSAASTEEQNCSPEEHNQSVEKLNQSVEEHNQSFEEHSKSNFVEEERSSSTELEDEHEPYDTEGLRFEVMGRTRGKDYMKALQKRIRLSVQQEYDNLCETPEFIRHYFLVRMPSDFFEFWKFLNTHKEGITNSDLLDYMAKEYDLMLVGPFEFMAGRFHKARIYEPGYYLRHWRFYYDPPEFQTIFVRRSTGVHFGYWRDKPNEEENLLIARNDASRGCQFEFIGGNLFESFRYFLERDCPQNPFRAKNIVTIKSLMAKYMTENAVEFQTLEALNRERRRRVVAKTFHGAGIVVDFDRTTKVGYRPLLVSEAELKKILKPFESFVRSENELENQEEINNITKAVVSKMQHVITAANVAMDESDHGTALELGINLFASGHKELHTVISSLLVASYSNLQRPQFIAISKAHMDMRRRDIKLSMFDIH